MSVIRVKKAARTPFVLVDITALNDTRMSFRAKGLHTYLMSKPDDWHVYIEQLEQESPREGRDAIRAALKELEDCGYVKRTRARGEKGRMAGWDTEVYETPTLAEAEPTPEPTEQIGLTEAPTSAQPTSAQPTSAQPTSAQPTSANPQLLNINLNQDLLLPKIEKTPPLSPTGGRSRKSGNLDTHYTPGFLQVWSLYPGGRRVAKPECFARWKSARLEPRANEIADRLCAWIHGPWQTMEIKHIPMLSTWLNQGRYEDDVPEAVPLVPVSTSPRKLVL